LILKQRFRL